VSSNGTGRPAGLISYREPAWPPQPDNALFGSAGPRRRLSPLRILLALILLAAAGCGGYTVVRARLAGEVTVRQTWFAPYVDVTLPPPFQFQSTTADPARQTVLGFVVAAGPRTCKPSWGAAYSLARADQQLALGSRIAQLQQDGAQPIVSFGGQAHTSLDVACTSTAALARAYDDVIRRYHLSTIDLDVEGTALGNFAAELRRARAIAAVERAAAGARRPLAVWLTLPVEPDGLQDGAVSVVSAMLRAHVAIAGVNVMTMDFSQSPGHGTTMLKLVEDALTATHQQLAALLPRYGISLRSAQLWQWLGATVMIGQNDVRSQNFSVADAAGLASFAVQHDLRRVSLWSINRDSQCGASFPELGLLSATCSGAAQSALQFTDTFTRLAGTASATTAAAAARLIPAAADTNPADAPYPTWSPLAQYPAGYKVVEHGEIYQARWFNSGDDPAAIVQYSYQTPWELLGPVLRSDRAPRIASPAGSYPLWSRTVQYAAGAQVSYDGLPYQARWVNEGVAPAYTTGVSADSPWRPLYTIPGEPSGSG
jgi:chitinase